MNDGGFVLAPVVEPDLYLYGADDQLRHVWDTRELGIDTGCDLSQEEFEAFNRDLLRQQAWIDSRRIVDEILPSSDGPLLIVRSVPTIGGAPQWELLRLGIPAATGDTGVVALDPPPLVAPSPTAHLLGDLVEDRVVLLSREMIQQDATRPVLFVGRTRSAETEPTAATPE